MPGTRLNLSCWALRLAYGLVPVVAGPDKLKNLAAARDVALSIGAFHAREAH
jgi:hypothetical protein